MMIKDTPDELGIPSFDIEQYADKLHDYATNPGISIKVMHILSTKVANEFGTKLSFNQCVKELEYLAQKHLRQPVTERIEKTQEATHKIIDGAHLFTNYEPAEKPDYYPHNEDPLPAG